MYTTLLRRIENYLKKTRTAPTRFGREAVRDPQLVFDLRNGRRTRRLTEARIHSYLDRQEALLKAEQCRRR